MNKRERKVIAIVLRSHPLANMGGAPYQAGIIADQLASGTDDRIVYLANRIPPDDASLPYDIQRISDPMHWLYRRSLVFDYFNLKRALDAVQPDVIYQNALTAHTGYCALYAKKHGAKFIYHVASDFDLLPNEYFAQSLHMKVIEWIEKNLAKKAYRTADHILVQTSAQKELLRQNYGRTECTVFPNLLPEPAEETERKKNPIKVIWVANFKPVKNPQLFVKLAQDLSSRQGLSFVMIGRPGLEMGYQSLLDKAQSMPNLEILGELNINNVNREIASSHILVNTSDTEGYSNTFVQAWQRGVPVLSLHADIEEQLKHEKLGLLGGDYEGLKSALVRMIDDEPLRESMSQSAAEYAEKNNSLTNIRKLIDLIEEKSEN